MSGEPIRIYGLDPSLSSTGVACIVYDSADDAEPNSYVWTERVTSPSRGCKRIDEIVRHVALLLSQSRTDVPGSSNGFSLVVIEAPIYHTPNAGLRGYHERAGLWWALVSRLWRTAVPFATVPPAVLKKYATGSGASTKDNVLARMVAEFPAAGIGSNDEADALACALIGAHKLIGEPFGVAAAKYRTELLSKVEWPIEPDSLGFAGPFAALAFAEGRTLYPAIAGAS